MDCDAAFRHPQCSSSLSCRSEVAVQDWRDCGAVDHADQVSSTERVSVERMTPFDQFLQLGHCPPTVALEESSSFSDRLIFFPALVRSVHQDSTRGDSSAVRNDGQAMEHVQPVEKISRKLPRATAPSGRGWCRNHARPRDRWLPTLSNLFVAPHSASVLRQSPTSSRKSVPGPLTQSSIRLWRPVKAPSVSEQLEAIACGIARNSPDEARAAVSIA